MSLKETIVQWNEGVERFHDGKYKEALGIWSAMVEPAARILYNIASMHLLLGDLDTAKKSLDLAVAKDPHLALAYFQRGCVALQQKRYADCVNDMDLAAEKLRNNPYINYKQLGLQFKLYSYEVVYNHACALFSLGQRAEAIEKLETARSLAGFASQQKIITAALESIKLENSFQSHQLPDNAMVFQPPRSKTEVLKPVNFLGKAKVVSSVKDQDSYVGFVGVQDVNKRRPRTSPPNSSISGIPVKPDISSCPRVPKPTGPAPGIPMKISKRKTSLDSSLNTVDFMKIRESSGRPLKPSRAPPHLHANAGKSKSPTLINRGEVSMDRDIKVSKMTVKVHYSTTRAIRVSTSISFKQLQSLICKKFDQEDDSLTLCCKNNIGELKDISDEETLKEACHSLDDGFRLTMWAYDKHEELEEDVPVLMTGVATHTYKGQFEDELSFIIGDPLDITADINDNWYEGRSNGSVGIFPKSHVKINL